MNLQLFTEVLLLCLVAAASPGPNFLMTAANSMEYGRKAGILTALGITLGVVIWLLFCGFGLGVLMAKFQWINISLQVAASLFLFYIGIKTLKYYNRSASRTPKLKTSDSRSFFMQGLVGTLLNGGVGVFYGAIFAKIITVYGHNVFKILVHGGVFSIIEAAWFLLVAFCVSEVRGFVDKYAKWINIILGILMFYCAVNFVGKLF